MTLTGKSSEERRVRVLKSYTETYVRTSVTVWIPSSFRDDASDHLTLQRQYDFH